LWDDRQRAQSLLKERTYLENALSGYRVMCQEFSDTKELMEIAEEEGDDPALKELTENLDSLQQQVKKQYVECLFSGDADSNDAFLEIHAGAGGTESQDWANMLLRMYLRWAERHDFKTEIINELAGEEVGVKSVTIRISGHNAYGWAKTESGVHRLVRISPFDSNAKRHTSFASVWVYPVIDETIEIEIDEKDLRIDTYRASGAGGQHVNKTDSAIRITHIPTNIVVQCQNSRSQHRNKAEAMNMLKARLYELELQKKEAEKSASNEQKTEIGWGHQIRSYVLHPYQMVKDLRTNTETSNTAAVLDGDIDELITASLISRLGSD
jgi:peptide chain release factor 2